MKLDRDPNRRAPHLEWRVRLLALGAVVAVAGMALESSWTINVAIVVLVAGFGLRFWPEEDDDQSDDESDDESPEAGERVE